VEVEGFHKNLGDYIASTKPAGPKLPRGSIYRVGRSFSDIDIRPPSTISRRIVSFVVLFSVISVSFIIRVSRMILFCGGIYHLVSVTVYRFIFAVKSVTS